VARKMMGVAIPAQTMIRERSSVRSTGSLGTTSCRSSTRQDKTEVKCFKRGNFGHCQSGCHSKHHNEVRLKHSHEEEPAFSMAVAYEGKETELMLKEEAMKPNPRRDAELHFITDMLYLDGGMVLAIT